MRPEPFDLTEQRIWGAFQRISPFRAVGGFGDLGGLPWEALQGALDREGLSRPERELWERLILAIDGTYRAECSRMMSDRAASRARGHRAH